MLLSVHVTSFLFSMVQQFRSDYGLLLELHALTLVARSYALLRQFNRLVSGSAQSSLGTRPGEGGFFGLLKSNCRNTN